MDTFGTSYFVFIEAAILFLIERLSSLQRLKCSGIIEKGPQSVSFIERLFYCILYSVSIIRGSSVYYIHCAL